MALPISLLIAAIALSTSALLPLLILRTLLFLIPLPPLLPVPLGPSLLHLTILTSAALSFPSRLLISVALLPGHESLRGRD